MNADRVSTEHTTSSTPLSDRSQVEMDLDNLIRRKLRVSDPNSENEIAEALGKRYEDDKREMKREASGLNFLPESWEKSISPGDTSSNTELEQAKTDVQRDLKALIGDNLVKDIQPELRGWSSAINSAIRDGVMAARFALDPQQRNRAFHCRRILNQYARIARYVGALTPNMNMSYRRLAQSLDEVSAVMLVLMGESLAKVGNAGGRFLLQVSASDLQERRDAVIYALRTFIGTSKMGTSQQDWPRGITAYRQFYQRLESSGQGDLKSLLQENVISRIMDDLIDRASTGNIEGLRSLGATFPVGLEGFQRLIFFGQHIVSPESPPLASFLTSLQLFLDAFHNAASGHRLLYIARPPIVYYGLYGLGGPNPDTHLRLLELAIARNGLAERLDCYLGCECGPTQVQCQIMLDKILYDVDRAIDLYAQGTDLRGRGEPEQRAMAYGFLIDYLLETDAPCLFSADVSEEMVDSLESVLERIRRILWHQNFKGQTSLTWVHNNGTEYLGDTHDMGSGLHIGEIRSWLTDLYNDVPPQCVINSGLEDEIVCQSVGSPKTEELESILKTIHHELCVQHKSENNWQDLLQTMAPSCIRFNGSLDATADMLDYAMTQVTGESESSCPHFKITIPPTVETSLDSIADDIIRTGENRDE